MKIRVEKTESRRWNAYRLNPDGGVAQVMYYRLKRSTLNDLLTEWQNAGHEVILPEEWFDGEALSRLERKKQEIAHRPSDRAPSVGTPRKEPNNGRR